MPLNKENKQIILAEVSAKIASAQIIVLAEYRGVVAVDLDTFRAKARKKGVYLRVLKNTLARRAVEGTLFSALAIEMTGPLIYGISEDPISAVKVLSDFSKLNDKLMIRAGSYNGKVLDKDGIKELADIPSREDLLIRFLKIVQFPIFNFVRVLNMLAEQKQNR